ncbi:hypothetical protein P8452_50020 [Trifolium repens]|nr:hypothetical protein P8452_50020 [Trifolium repens]
MPPKMGKARKSINKMSKSRKSPISARRNLIPNSTAIFDRRLSLRSSSRLQTGTTSLEQVGEMHVENSTLGIPEKAGELGEAEMSVSSCSNQNAGQNIFEAETIPVEQEPLAEEIQASNAGCSAPCISLKLTEMVNMVRNEDDDNDVDSTLQSWPEDTVNGYKVDAEFMPILSKIIEKHGDIAKNCKVSMEYRSMLLDRIFEVKWLHTRLTEIREARQILKQLGPMKDRFDNNRESIEIAESTLKAFEDKKMEASEKLKEASKNFDEICKKEVDWKDKLARSRDKSIEISQKIVNATSKVKQFLNCSLIDDLL